MSFPAFIVAAVSAATAPVLVPVLPLEDVFFRVPTASMEPTLPIGSLVVAEPIETLPNRGDLVMVRTPNSPDARVARRVIGIPGDRIQLDNTHAVVNGEILADYGRPLPSVRIGFAQYPAWGQTYVVPQDSVYVLADNRPEGIDSIDYGAIARGNISARLYAWSEVVAHRGKMTGVFAAALTAFRKRLPLPITEGIALRDVEVLDDTSLRSTFVVTAAVGRGIRSAFSDSLVRQLQADACDNRLFKLAIGLNVTYVFVEAGTAEPLMAMVRQDACNHHKQ
jgi:signal peptidase I